MLFDPLFIGNAALFAGVFGASFLDLSDLFDGDDDSATPDEGTGDALDETPLEVILGTESADDIQQTAPEAREYDLLGGDDTLDANIGDDTIRAGEGNDSVLGRLGDDRIDMGNGDDFAAGGFGADLIIGGDAGVDGNDTLLGDAGEDTLAGGAGDDLLQGGKEADILEGDGGNDTLEGGEGADLLEGGDGEDSLNGTYGLGTLSRTIADDLADTLDGGAGDDILRLGVDDIAIGGDGSDTFLVDAAILSAGGTSAPDTPEPAPTVIRDFVRGIDSLEVEYEGATAPESVVIQELGNGAGTAIVIDGVTVATLEGVTGLTPDAVRLVQAP